MSMTERRVFTLPKKSTSGFGTVATPTPYRFVGITGDLATASGARTIGVCPEGVVQAGDEIPVVRIGTMPAYFSGNASPGDQCAIDTNNVGTLKAATAGATVVAVLLYDEDAVTTATSSNLVPREVVLIEN